MRRLLISLAFLVTLGSTAMAQSAVIPEFVIVDEKTSDIPVRTQVEQHILVKGDITKEGLEALLRSQYESIMRRRGFKYHNPATNVFIYVYDSREKATAGQGLWIAMLDFTQWNNGKPTINVDEELIIQLTEKPVEKFGLSEEKRKEIFVESVNAGDRAMNESIELEPSDIYKQIDLQRELEDKYKNKVAKKYNLTRDQLNKIGFEGVKKKWLMPSVESVKTPYPTKPPDSCQIPPCY